MNFTPNSDLIGNDRKYICFIKANNDWLEKNNFSYYARLLYIPEYINEIIKFRFLYIVRKQKIRIRIKFLSSKHKRKFHVLARIESYSM